MTATFLPGIVIPLRPFFGSMGVAPALEVGRVSSNPPSTHAGNLDNKELVAGTTLFIPVHVKGALFEVGDGHAAQGDGEVDQTAIETSLRGTHPADRAQGHEAGVAARRNQHALHLDGHRRRPAHRDADRDPGDGGLPRRRRRRWTSIRPISSPASPAMSPSRSSSTARWASTSRCRRASSRFNSSTVQWVQGFVWFRFSGSRFLLPPVRRTTRAERPEPVKKPVDAQHAGITTPHGDHSPHHGGLVLMNGEVHYEVVFDPPGKHRVWFSDAVREDLPASIASHVVMMRRRPGWALQKRWR